MHTRSRLVPCSIAGLISIFALGCSDEGTGAAGGGQSDPDSSAVGGHSGATISSSVAGSSSAGGSSSSSPVSSGGQTPTGGSSAKGGTTTTSRVGGTTDAGGTTAKPGGTTATGTTTTGGSTGTTGGRTGGRVAGTTAGGNTGSAGANGGSPPNTTPNGTSSAGYLVPARKFFGNIDTRGSIRSDFKTFWDQFSPENAGKWDSVQGGGAESWNWKSLDTMYKYCQDNNILFKEHTFCWGPQQPKWVNDTNGEAAVKAWMKAFCDRYPDTFMIDVFNESLHNSPNYKNGIGGTGKTGYDWLVNAFKWAREACPKAILLYNDYNTIEYANENSGVIKLVKAVKGAGAPIDGVGCQAHDVGLVSTATAKSYVEKIISETGLPVYITEMDVGKADDAQQLSSIKGLVEGLWNNEMVKGWTYWGYVGGATWRSNTELISSSGAKRASMTWLMSFLKR
jgi:endo-1,4-beta-xylanase